MNRRVGEVALVAIAIVLSLMGVLSENWFGARLDEGDPKSAEDGASEGEL